jgi:hypothetical protein
VYDVPGVAALNSISSNPILFIPAGYLAKGRGGEGLSALSLWYSVLLYISVQYGKVMSCSPAFLLYANVLLNSTSLSGALSYQKVPYIDFSLS